MNCVEITSDNRFAISGSSDNSIKIFDLKEKKEVHHFQNVHKSKNFWLVSHLNFVGEIDTLAITSDNRLLISGSADRSLKIFDLKEKKEIHHFQNAHESNPLSVSI